jgi:hypothetical protein
LLVVQALISGEVREGGGRREEDGGRREEREEGGGGRREEGEKRSHTHASTIHSGIPFLATARALVQI